MKDHWDGDFFRTPYQVACQLGLYYESDDGYFHPRFDHNICAEEALEYLEFWAPRYYVPNPYTSDGSFDGIPDRSENIILHPLADILQRVDNAIKYAQHYILARSLHLFGR